MNSAHITLCNILVVYVFSAYPGDTIGKAPVSSDFIAWKNANATQKGMEVSASVNGHGLGYIPSPFDWSHLSTEQTTKGLVQAAAALPAALDLRGSCMTSVKNQGQCGCCWAFGTYGALESWLLKIKGETWDFSEQHLITTSGFDPTCCEGGNWWMSVAYLSRWSGPVNESDDPYGETNSTNCTPLYGLPVQKYLDSMVIFSTTTDIKNALMTYGALNTTMYMDEKAPYYDSTTYCYYYPYDSVANHSVTIAGWDDTKAVAGAPQNGAWLIKNSWGTAWGDSGYFWVSYSDAVACKQAVAFSGAVPVTSYATNYYYDTLGCVGQWGYGSDSAWAATIYTAGKSEYLTAVGFYAVSNNASYTVTIDTTFSNGSFSHALETTTGALSFAGYYTIQLPSRLYMAKGSRFCIVVKFVTPGYNYPIPAEAAEAGYSSKATASSGRSYISSTGVSFTDFSSSSATACIRGLTQAAAPSAPTLISPTNASVNQATALTLTWGTSALATSYEVQVSLSSTFGTTFLDQSGISSTSRTVSSLTNSTMYYWRANASNGGGTSSWSNAWSFSTAVRLVIPLVASWNMKSLNIHPTDSTTGGVFGAYKGFLLVSDGRGNVYIPTLGVNEIGTLTTGRGYQIYTDSTDTIRVTGTPVNVATTSISLQTLIWGIIAYLPQVNMPPATALAGIVSQIILASDNAGDVYWPSFGINEIDTMRVGEGYYVVTSAAATLTYPSGQDKRQAGGKAFLSLPDPRHFSKHRITGNHATLLAKSVMLADRLAPDGSEIGAFDEAGNCIGGGTVIRGLAAFAVWGKDPQTKRKDGAVASEKISFKLWDGVREYPLDFISSNGLEAHYSVNAVFLGRISVSPGALITRFDLSRAYPNPFRGSVKIAFDVPTITGVSQHAIEINVYDLKGSLVKQLASGMYKAGHYAVAWNCNESHEVAAGSNVFIVRMKATDFDKRLKLVSVK